MLIESCQSSGFEIHAAGLGISDREVLVRDSGHAEMTRMHGLQLSINEIDAEVIAFTEFELQFDETVLKLGRVEDGDTVIGLGVFRDVHGTVLEIDLLVAFGPPGAVAGPAVANVFFAWRGFIAIEVIREKRRDEIRVE
jgi:hypothetical protein